MKHFTALYVFFVYFLPLTLDYSKCGHPSWFRPRLLAPVSILFCYLMKILLSLFEPKLIYYQKNMAIFNFFPVHREIHYMILETLYMLLFCIFLAFLSSSPPWALKLHHLICFPNILLTLYLFCSSYTHLAVAGILYVHTQQSNNAYICLPSLWIIFSNISYSSDFLTLIFLHYFSVISCIILFPQSYY